MHESQEIMLAETRPVVAGFQSVAAFELLNRAGKMLAASQLMPEIYRGDVASCALIVNIALRINADPVLVANNLDIIYGRPSWRSQFLIASVNACGRFSALRFEFKGTPGADDYGCRAWAIERSTNERIEGVWITWALVKAEGWSQRKGSKWGTMPDQMFIYRSAAFWTRAYAPEIALGFPTDDETRDIIDVTAAGSATVGPGSTVGLLNAAIAAEAKTEPATVGNQSANPDAPQTGKPANPESALPTADAAEAAALAETLPPAAPPHGGAGVAETFVAEAIDGAGNADSFNLAVDLIRGVKDGAARDRLTKRATAKRATLAPAR